MTEDGASEPNWRVHQVLLTEEAIYGLILVSGMIVVSGQSGTASIEVLVTVIVTVAVFYAAHVYAGAVARLAAVGRTGHLRHALAHAARQSSGLLVAAVVPVVILALGTTHVISGHHRELGGARRQYGHARRPRLDRHLAVE